MSLIILSPPEESTTARIHGVVPDMQKVEAQVRKRVEPNIAIATDEVANHIGGERMTAADHV
jgi:hypothetical protein